MNPFRFSFSPGDLKLEIALVITTQTLEMCINLMSHYFDDSLLLFLACLLLVLFFCLYLLRHQAR